MKLLYMEIESQMETISKKCEECAVALKADIEKTIDQVKEWRQEVKRDVDEVEDEQRCVRDKIDEVVESTLERAEALVAMKCSEMEEKIAETPREH